jgi:pimeloyl-ACP methyl ester carboxylesterase
VEVENTTLHFVHEKSADDAAIPILMAHGWPGKTIYTAGLYTLLTWYTGSFLEYLPTVPLLTRSQPGEDNHSISYNVVIPSLPGFGFSSLASNTWTPEDTARIFNTLMVDVLGYKNYTVFGSDWVSSQKFSIST